MVVASGVVTMARVFCAPIVKRPGRVRSIGLAILCLTALTGCESHPALDHGDGAVTGTGPADGAPSVEVGACPAPIPTSPCRVDSDCQNPYLVCERPNGGVFVCRDAQAAVDPTCPSLVDATDVPTCPMTVPVPYSVCIVRYQRPCTVETDCGPAGFTCAGGRCQGSGTLTTCSTAADCPRAWDCYAPCACPGTEGAKVCEPPFAEFGCPACAATRP
jgi:hypothetical protein